MINIIKKRLPVIVVCLMVLSASTVLSDKVLGRNLFYLAIAFTSIFTAINYKKFTIQREDLLLAIAFLCVGISQFYWFQRFPAEPDTIFMADINYPRTATYLLLTALLVLFLPSLAATLHLGQRSQLLITLLVVVGFTYMCAVGLYYSFTHPGMRLRIDSAATVSAYLCVLQGLLTLYVIYNINFRKKYIIVLFVIGITTLVILLTQTRSVFIIYPLVLLAFALINRLWSFRTIVGSGVLLAGVLALVVGLLFHNFFDRMTQVYNQVSEYNSNNNTSVGARISMWKSGLYATTVHPGGQSAAMRFHEVSHYMDVNERGNPEGKRNAVYHLHNDVIDSLSLQGIAGGLSLIFLFISLIFYFYRKKIIGSTLAFSVMPVVGFGMVDTLFINDRFIVMLAMQVSLFVIMANKKTGNNIIDSQL